ncbi:MAG TPA: iron-containing alcohol dehydrogenase [Clostridiaceae bacterium]|nr:iron-containing alcohol dehydrogenase [Clostridiaceae bacterium]
MTFSMMIPAVQYAGAGSIKKLENILNQEQITNLLLFTDESVLSLGLCDSALNILKQKQIKFEIISNLKAEPSYLDIEKALNAVEMNDATAILAIGGGSVIDAAKLCSLLYQADYTLRDVMEDSSIGTKKLISIVVPTTCGTGAEATLNAIVVIPERETKQGIVNSEMIPDYVILDSDMIRRLPKSILAATGVDALAHAVECFTSNKATPLSDTYAVASAKLIFKNIQKAYNNADDMIAKQNMLLGAFYGGVAINGSGTTAVHALSYPLGGKFHLAHGVSNAILFAHVMEFNKDVCADRLAILCDAVYPEFVSEHTEKKAQKIIDKIAEIVKTTNIPTNLNEFGIKEDDLEDLVQAASQQTRLLVNNMKDLSLDDMRFIYHKVMK